MKKSRKSKRLAAKRASEASDPFIPSSFQTENNVPSVQNDTESKTEALENHKSIEEKVENVVSSLSDCVVSNNIDGNTSSSMNASTSVVNSQESNTSSTAVKKEVIREIPPETEPVPPFQVIDQNDYLFDRRKCRSRNDIRRMVCDCILTKEERHRKILGCTEDCLNRMLMIECGSRCPVGEQCANKRFQKKQYAKVQPFRAGLKGWGLRAMQRIPAGSFVLEYVGEVVDPEMFRSRVKKYDRDGQVHHYFMALKSDEIIDATVKGNIGRFTNHSCEPNCETQKWTVNGDLRVGFFAIKNIEAGEEVTLDYQFQRYGKEAQKCYCGAESCRGFIGATEESTIDLDGSKMTSKQKSRIASIDAKLRAREFEDVALEKEIDKLVSTGFLKNKLQTMSLARIMVRTEDTSCRMKLLNVINNTQVQVFLRLFLDYHGLQLLWSWMYDADDPWLKASILQVLSILPIPNRTVLVDSKVLDMVQKWTIPEETKPIIPPVIESQAEEKPSQQLPQEIDDEVKRISQDSCSNSQSSIVEALAADEMMPDESEVANMSHDTSMEENADESTSLPTSDIKPDVKAEEKKVEETEVKTALSSETKQEETTILEIPKADESSQSSDDKDTKSEEDDMLKELPNISQLAERLLFMWKDLKEGFKIPRVIRQNRLNDEKEASQTLESESSRPRNDTKGNEGNSILLRRKKPVNSTNQGHPLNHNPDYIQMEHQEASGSSMDSAGPPRVSKEQHRLQFEMEEMKRKHHEEMERYRLEMEMLKEQMRQKELVTPEGYTFDPLAFNPMSDGFQTGLSIPADVLIAGPPDSYQHFDQYSEYGIQESRQVVVEDEVMYDYPEYQEAGYFENEDSATEMIFNNNSCILIECTPPENELSMTDERAGALTDYGYEYVPAKQSPRKDFSDVKLFDKSYPPPGVYYECIFDDTVYYVPRLLSNDDHSFEFFGSEIPTSLPNNSFLTTAVSAPLPRLWCRAKDDVTGRFYYFNKKTGKVQWTLPHGSGIPPKPISNEFEAEIVRKATLESIVASADSTATPPLPLHPSSSPSNSQASPPGIFAIVNGHERAKASDGSVRSSSKKKKKTKGAVYDIRTKQGLIKFKEEISDFVKKVLNPYRSKDCKVARITSDEDFKALARKLTNEVYQKEIHSGKVELFVSEVVKSKAKNYIKKYMLTKGHGVHRSSHSPSTQSFNNNSIFVNSEDHSMEGEEETHSTHEEDVGIISTNDADT